MGRNRLSSSDQGTMAVVDQVAEEGFKKGKT